MRLPKNSERLDPPLIDVLVTDGICEDEKQEINKAEARYIVDEIKRICVDPKMKDKTIGVVTLKGDRQEHFIYDMLERELSYDLLESHAIKCGNARAFQGEERNIIFLSLVVSFNPNCKKPMPLTKEDAYQRFNVAASRARDRMYLVRSIEMNENQLSNKDVLRRGIIKHFSLPFGREEKKNKNLRNFCETDFERQIYDILFDLGYHVIPQVKVGSYRIDLVVEGNNDNRLAIDCHGDKLQSAEQDDYNLNRQRILERNGWEFWNSFAFNFVLNKENVIKDLIKKLEEKDIKPAKTKNINQNIYTEQRIVTVFKKNENVS
jgi:very-short-patch-repair endonuclease